jgi:prephenate dehydrogenase
MTNPASIQRAAVLGASGSVGRLLVNGLLKSGVSVVGLDRQEPAGADGGRHLPCDACEMSAAARIALATADAVVLCLPEATALAALPGVLAAAADGALIVDTLSVKQRVVDVLMSRRPGQECLSINPLFSPKVGFAGENVAVVEVASGRRSAEFLRLLQGWGAQVVRVSAEEHDRLAAAVQVATHAMLLTLGQTLGACDYDIERGLQFSTPPHRICLALLARMCDAAPEVYWDVQRSNDYGSVVRARLADSLRRLQETVARGHEHEFDEIITGIAAVLRPRREELLQRADALAAASRA